MYSVSLHCPGCCATFEAFGYSIELDPHHCSFCGTPLEESAGTSTNAAVEDAGLLITQGPMRRL